MPVVIGVDSSTQSTKAEVRDLDTGRLLGSGRASHPPTTPPRSEQDPTSWWVALTGSIHQATRAAGVDGDAVVAISVAGQQHGMVVLDASGSVIRPAKLWNDTQSAAEATAMVERLGAQRWAAACGSVPRAAFTVTKLAWLAIHEPTHLDRVASVLLPHDWLTYRLCGRLVTDRGDASGTGYWSPAEGRWRPDLLADAIGRGRTADDWAACLPLVLGPSDRAGELTAGAAAELGLRAHRVHVGPGTGDNMAAALGIGLGPGDVAVSIGTSGTVYAVSDRPTADPSGAVAGFADATGHFLPLVCTLNAALVTDAIARLLGVDPPGLDALALAAPAGAEGLTLLPYLAGERTPNRPDATGILAGLRTDIRREAVARAAFEGVVCGLLDGLDALAAARVAMPDRLVLVGGGSRSPAYRQVLADLAGLPVTVPDETEAVAAGAAVQAAAVALGTSPRAVSLDWGIGAGTIIEPDPGVDRQAVRQAYSDVRDNSPDRRPRPGPSLEMENDGKNLTE